MKKNKIVVIFDGLGFGGIERVGVNYLKILDDLGYNITVYNLSPKYNDLIKEIPSNIKISNITLTRFHVIDTYNQRFSKNLLWLMVKPLFWLILSLYFLFIKPDKEQYDLGIAFSGHFSDLKFLNSKKIHTKNKLTWLHGSLDDYLSLNSKYKKHYDKIKNLVVLSDRNSELWDTSMYNIEKIFNPVDILDKKINETKINDLKNQYGDFMLMIGRFTKQKDHKFIVDVYDKLYTDCNITNKLLFVGDGETKEEINRYVNTKKLHERIFFVGSQINVQDYYKASYIYLHASPAEGLPTVLIESMMFGIPIVTTNSLPGVPELINNEKIGIVCELGDINCMKEGILKLINSKEHYESYRTNSLIRSEEFKKDIIKGKISRMIIRILDNN